MLPPFLGLSRKRVMGLRKLRCGIAFWLGLLALTVSGLAQNDLSTNVLIASLADAANPDAAHHGHASGHSMPDGTWMAGDMGGMPDRHEYNDPATNGGHSHKGHSDCVLCGPLAAMAAFTQPPPLLLILPDASVITPYRSVERDFVMSALRTPYSSRAPPRQQA